MANKWHINCPHCDKRVVATVNITREPRVTSLIIAKDEPPPDKPPAVGDWVYSDGWIKPIKVRRRSNTSDTTVILDDQFGTPYRDEDLRIVRLRDAPLQKGDRGLLDGKIEVWVTLMGEGDLRLVFQAKDLKPSGRIDYKDDFAWVDGSRFTLTEPVYPDGEKLSGKEKED